jgi:hypothetical protein
MKDNTDWRWSKHISFIMRLNKRDLLAYVQEREIALTELRNLFVETNKELEETTKVLNFANTILERDSLYLEYIDKTAKHEKLKLKNKLNRAIERFG